MRGLDFQNYCIGVSLYVEFLLAWIVSRLALPPKVFQISSQPPDFDHIYSVVIADPDPAHTPMSFETLQQLRFCTLQESFLLPSVSSIYSKANVHPTANGTIRDNLIDVGISIEDIIDLFRFRICQFFLTGQLAIFVGLEKTSHDFASYPDTEDGHCVVK